MSGFDAFNFTNTFGRTLGTQVSSSASGLNTGISQPFSSGLSQAGMSINSIKSLVSSRLDSFTNFLSPDSNINSNFSRISQSDLFFNRSVGQYEDTEVSSKISSSRNQLADGNQIRFPRMLRNEFCRIEFAKYVRPDTFERPKFNTISTIDLPLPRDLMEQHSVNISPEETGIYGAAASQIREIVAAAQGKSTSTQDQLLNNAAGLGYYALTNATGEQIGGMIGQYAGAIPNPHMSMFFKGVQLRESIEFSWLLTPRNEEESILVKKLIGEFKRNILPRVTSGHQNIMDYPNMVNITLYPWNNTMEGNSKFDDQSAPVFKRGLISSFNVQYSPNGLAFFKSAAYPEPAFVVISFIFNEIEIFTASDFGGGYAEDISDKLSSIKQGVLNAKDNIVANLTGGKGGE